MGNSCAAQNTQFSGTCRSHLRESQHRHIPLSGGNLVNRVLVQRERGHQHSLFYSAAMCGFPLPWCGGGTDMELKSSHGLISYLLSGLQKTCWPMTFLEYSTLPCEFSNTQSTVEGRGLCFLNVIPGPHASESPWGFIRSSESWLLSYLGNLKLEVEAKNLHFHKKHGVDTYVHKGLRTTAIGYSSQQNIMYRYLLLLT